MRTHPLRLRAVLAATSSLLLPLLLSVPAEAAAQDFGATAYSPSKHVAAAAFAGSQPAAASAAVEKCRALGNASDCWPLGWFRNAAGSVAVSPNGAYGSGWGFSNNGDYSVAKGFADKYAVEVCQKYGGRDCNVIFTARTSTISSAGAGGEVTLAPDLLGQLKRLSTNPELVGKTFECALEKAPSSKKAPSATLRYDYVDIAKGTDDTIGIVEDAKNGEPYMIVWDLGGGACLEALGEAWDLGKGRVRKEAHDALQRQTELWVEVIKEEASLRPMNTWLQQATVQYPEICRNPLLSGVKAVQDACKGK